MGTAFRMLIVVIAVGALGARGAAERRVMARRGRRISTPLSGPSPMAAIGCLNPRTFGDSRRGSAI
jgi:hypothetical protein